MSLTNFEEGIQKIVAKDSRYDAQAYYFVTKALWHTEKSSPENQDGTRRHVTGKELLEVIRDYAVATLGSSAKSTLKEWGIHSCEDFGEIVFTMVESGLLGKSERDSRADFNGGYTFDEAFPEAFYRNRRFWVCCIFGLLLVLVVIFISVEKK